MNAFLISIRNLIFMTLLLGGIYPVLVMGIGQLLFPIRSNGSVVIKDGKTLGSELLAQKFTKEEYFWSRPSSVDYAAHSGGASQKSGTSKELKEQYLSRQATLGKGAPADLLYTSGSGLDPHISLSAANFQKGRIMTKRNLSEADMDKFIVRATEERFLGFMGQPRVNVLRLNLLLDGI